MTGLDGASEARRNGGGGAERHRLQTDHEAWRRWGPYLAERAWATVREDYSPDGSAWDSFPHDHARSRAYRWSEDGMAGVCDAGQRLCLALALWNGHDPILKERMFGLTGTEGRHGEDAKEHWWYADAVPSGAWLRWKYAYPLDGYPYQELLDGNASRGPGDPGFGLLDTGVFDPEPDGTDGSGRWADVTVEYAKAAPDDLVLRVRVENMSVRPASVHVMPTLWFRNTWSWGPGVRGSIDVEDGLLVARHPELPTMLFAASSAPDGTWPEPLFCENETNLPRLYGAPARTPWPKDGINDHVVHGRETVNPALTGSKAAVRYRLDLGPREAAEVVVRLTAATGDGIGGPVPDTGPAAIAVLHARRAEADAFHRSLLPAGQDAERAVHRQAVAGLVWSQCYYHYDVGRWLDGDPYQPAPPAARRAGRNAGWGRLRAHDVICVPDPWERPWFAAWDLAFQSVALAHVDPVLAKQQLLLLLGERYLRPDGRLPAHEWDLDDADPPVQAWAALRIFEIDGGTDFAFLTQILHRLLFNVTWWLARADRAGGGGRPASDAGTTAWTAAYCLDLWEMCRRLAAHDPAQAPVHATLAQLFRERFAALAPVDGNGGAGLVPLLAVRGAGGESLAAVSPRQLSRVLAQVFDESRFLGPTGIRSRSRASGDYEPGDSSDRPWLNSNWQGPVWFPVNQLLVEAVRRHGEADGDLVVELPARSGHTVSLARAAGDLADRLISTFLPGPDGVPPFARPTWDRMPVRWRDRLVFHECFDGDTGAGVGSSHQTGWTALVVDLLADRVRDRRA
ncbi:MAG: hypothetical protein QG622_3040 [Actinomycetota bacterium]|nr:hypothetical protein [Actinomycetota bacterium]